MNAWLIFRYRFLYWGQLTFDIAVLVNIEPPVSLYHMESSLLESKNVSIETLQVGYKG